MDQCRRISALGATRRGPAPALTGARLLGLPPGPQPSAKTVRNA